MEVSPQLVMTRYGLSTEQTPQQLELNGCSYTTLFLVTREQPSCINPLSTKLYLSNLKTQFAPRQ